MFKAMALDEEKNTAREFANFFAFKNERKNERKNLRSLGRVEKNPDSA